MAHYASHLIGNDGECWIARGRWGDGKRSPSSFAQHPHGGEEVEREREREREIASDARGWNSLGQGKEVLTFVNGRGAEFCA